MVGSKLFPPKLGDTVWLNPLPNYRDAEVLLVYQLGSLKASLDGKGRPSCHERPSYLDAWLSCAGSGELAPEVGIFKHN